MKLRNSEKGGSVKIQDHSEDSSEIGGVEKKDLENPAREEVAHSGLESENESDSSNATSVDTIISLDFNTKLFRHYKNKSYRYHSIAKHSETLEDYVVYEACYPNPESKLWIRPKEMFFGRVNVGSRSVSRFEQVPLFLRKVTQFSEDDILTVKHLSELCFGEWNDRKFRAKLSEAQRPMMIIAHVEATAVGYKIGYELDSETFFSWMGGIVPQSRRLGFASQLARHQMDWCRGKGYKKIQMRTRNKFTAMIGLNLKLGFQIIDVVYDSQGEREILMEMRL